MRCSSLVHASLRLLSINRVKVKIIREPGIGEDAGAVLDKIKSAYMNGLQTCYKKHLVNEPTARGKIQLAFEVNESGRVVAGKAKGFANDVDVCVSALMSRWTFPRPVDEDGDPTSVNYSIGLQLVPAIDTYHRSPPRPMPKPADATRPSTSTSRAPAILVNPTTFTEPPSAAVVSLAPVLLPLSDETTTTDQTIPSLHVIRFSGSCHARASSSAVAQPTWPEARNEYSRHRVEYLVPDRSLPQSETDSDCAC